jgi:hypothetical protein
MVSNENPQESGLPWSGIARLWEKNMAWISASIGFSATGAFHGSACILANCLLELTLMNS